VIGWGWIFPAVEKDWDSPGRQSPPEQVSRSPVVCLV
jgi:hypothetical protein